MEKKGAVLLLLITLIFISSSSSFFSASATTCTEVGPNIQPCLRALNGLPLTPPTTCCDGLKVLVKLGNEMGVGNACNCTKAFLMNVPGLDVDVKVFNDLQSKCEVDIGFNPTNGTKCDSS